MIMIVIMTMITIIINEIFSVVHTRRSSLVIVQTVINSTVRWVGNIRQTEETKKATNPQNMCR
jgi:hypothetical protein